jgi:hypothetical protein
MGGELIVTATSAPVRSVLKVAGLDELVDNPP